MYASCGKAKSGLCRKGPDLIFLFLGGDSSRRNVIAESVVLLFAGMFAVRCEVVVCSHCPQY